LRKKQRDESLNNPDSTSLLHPVQHATSVSQEELDEISNWLEDNNDAINILTESPHKI